MTTIDGLDTRPWSTGPLVLAHSAAWAAGRELPTRAAHPGHDESSRDHRRNSGDRHTPGETASHWSFRLRAPNRGGQGHRHQHDRRRRSCCRGSWRRGGRTVGGARNGKAGAGAAGCGRDGRQRDCRRGRVRRRGNEPDPSQPCAASGGPAAGGLSWLAIHRGDRPGSMLTPDKFYEDRVRGYRRSRPPELEWGSWVLPTAWRRLRPR